MSSMEADVQCTSFPNLFDDDDPIRESSSLTYKWPCSLRREDLTHSWARLLHAYTGHSDPVFLFQGTATQVDSSSGVCKDVNVDEQGEQTCFGTSLILDHVRFYLQQQTILKEGTDTHKGI